MATRSVVGYLKNKVRLWPHWLGYLIWLSGRWPNLYDDNGRFTYGYGKLGEDFQWQFPAPGPSWNR